MKRLLTFLFCLASINILADEAQIRSVLNQHFPTVEISSIQPTSIAGLYEVLAGGKIFYIDQTGEYMLPGPLVETRTKLNLTQLRLDDIRAIKFSRLPLDKSIKIVRGNGTREIAVFSDPDCPFSKLLLRELYLLDDLTIYVFLNPLLEIHPDALQRSNEIWCSEDRAKSLLDYMILDKKPANQGKCVAPVNDILALSDLVGVNSTPVLVFQNDMRVDGAMYGSVVEDVLKVVYDAGSNK